MPVIRMPIGGETLLLGLGNVWSCEGHGAPHLGVRGPSWSALGAEAGRSSDAVGQCSRSGPADATPVPAVLLVACYEVFVGYA